jgi:nucleoside-diphosphate-sugar epimerase
MEKAELLGINILITGASGFVGSNMLPYLKLNINPSITSAVRYKEKNKLQKYTDDAIVYDTIFLPDSSYSHYIHLAGKAHDLKKTSDESEYFKVNYELTKKLYDRFLSDKDAKCFIFFSSVKAVADTVKGELSEEFIPNPVTAYGRSKLKAENYILDNLSKDKSVVILRPCMIHGPGNKGNLNLLYNIVSRGIPWPLGNFDNNRSFLSIDNLCYVVEQIVNGNVRSGVYNLADDDPLSTSELIRLISDVNQKKSKILNIPRSIIQMLAKIGNMLPLPLNEERLEKLTENYVVSNSKIKAELGIERMPLSTIDGMLKTLNSFQKS